MADAVLLLQFFSTIAMVGLVWFVQVVHYPLMERVGKDEFCRYERDHQTRTTMVVAPLMLTEAVTALLVLWIRPSSVPLAPALFGLFSRHTIREIPDQLSPGFEDVLYSLLHFL